MFAKTRIILRHFARRKDGATAVEFAIMGTVMFGVMFGFFDVAFALYVRNNFNHAVNAAAREVYVDPDRKNSEIKADLAARLTKYSKQITTSVSTSTSGPVEYKVINVQMTYHYKSPLLNKFSVTLKGESRAPILDYQI